MQVLKDLWTSKKFRVALFTVIGSLAAEFGFEADWKKLAPALLIVIGWLLSQGLADQGKERIKELKK
jgi:hypothetical protein